MPAKTTSKKTDNVFSKEERAAVAATARERKAISGNPEQERAEGLAMLKESLAKMPADDRAMGERIHELVSKSVPELVPGTYYGMPSYRTAGKNGKTIAFYKAKSKFRVRYSTVGFQPDAKLDDGDMWPTEFAVIKLTPAVEANLVKLVKKAAS
jgi:uncharacterized protein YdhG (YjbR/CyaY superfamily)